jgi:hypothetical protein
MLKFDPDATIYERGKNLSETRDDWPFQDPPNTAVITNVPILDGAEWVQYVTHDEEDGAWQFHPAGGQATTKEAAVTSLRRILAIEPRVAELADLPLGWHAWRDDEDGVWTREAKQSA